MGKIILTGDRPTGRLHVGHYVGSLRNRVMLQNSGKFEKLFFMIADAQALTDNFDHPQKVRENIMQVALDYLSCGIDPAKSTILVQSHISELTELTFYYMNLVTLARLERNPTVKAEIQLRGFNHSIPMGFLTYPVSQTADITAFMADTVPVGEDQRQHVELTRDIAQRFNSVYSDTFVLPQAFIPKVGARLMSLDDPTTKMSKSLPDGCVNLMDAPEVIMKKFKRAVTDCETAVKYDKENKAGISNLLTIYCAATGKTLAEAEAEFADQGYGVFKPAVGEAVVELVRPISDEAHRLLSDKAYLESIYKSGAERASYLANKTLRKVYKKVGFVAR